ncbi:MAG TPA: hypothetical protein VKT73_06770 [Xanthobacteraceae bacterium]|nr:hypothetical protein [Xanthobacteraceae bacterium]
MTHEEFVTSLAHPAPREELSPALAALWWVAKGDWKRAHALVNDRDGRDEAWVHAHLHRVEGDGANANYYRRAGKTPSADPLPVEHEAIARALLQASA